MTNQIKKYKITKIRWDSDDGDISHLPTSKVLFVQSSELKRRDLEEIVVDMLTDSEGWMVHGCVINEVKWPLRPPARGALLYLQPQDPMAIVLL